MSLDALKQQAAALDAPARKELFSFLISLREQQWAAQARAMARHLDDPDQTRWLSLKVFQTRLDRLPEPAE